MYELITDIQLLLMQLLPLHFFAEMINYRSLHFSEYVVIFVSKHDSKLLKFCHLVSQPVLGNTHIRKWSRDKAVGIVTGYGLDD
jgi:hypothetical protein